jgi:hypothetical protein
MQENVRSRLLKGFGMLAARGSKSFLRAVVYAAAAEKSERVTWFEIREV